MSKTKKRTRRAWKAPTDPDQMTKQEQSSIRRKVKIKIAEWDSAPRQPIFERLTLLRNKYNERRAAKWRRNLHSQKAELYGLEPRHRRDTCNSCSDGECAVRARINELYRSVEKLTKKLVEFEALKIYDTSGAHDTVSASPLAPQRLTIVPITTGTSHGSPLAASASRSKNIRERQQVSTSNNQSTSDSMSQSNRNTCLSRSALDFKVATSRPSNSRAAQGSPSQTQKELLRSQAAKPSTQTKKRLLPFTASDLDSDSLNATDSGAESQSSGGDNLGHGSNKKNNLAIRVPGRAKGAEARFCDNDTPAALRRLRNVLQKLDESDVRMSTSQNTSTVANETMTISKSKPEGRFPNIHQNFKMSGALPARPSPGTSADAAIKVESDNDDTCDYTSVRGSNSFLSSTRGSGVSSSYSLLSKDELLLLVGKKDAERANASHRAKVREYLCKYQGISDTMIEAFETKLSNKGTWESAAKEIIGTDRKRLLDAPPNPQRRATTHNSE